MLNTFHAQYGKPTYPVSRIIGLEWTQQNLKKTLYGMYGGYEYSGHCLMVNMQNMASLTQTTKIKFRQNEGKTLPPKFSTKFSL